MYFASGCFDMLSCTLTVPLCIQGQKMFRINFVLNIFSVFWVAAINNQIFFIEVYFLLFFSSFLILVYLFSATKMKIVLRGSYQNNFSLNP